MARRRDALTELRTAFNCPAKWSEMKGDDRVRHCTKCARNVYNISAMSRQEAVDFLEQHGEKICVRFYQRADGTILTQPCGAIKKFVYRFKFAVGSAFAAVGLMAFMPGATYAGARAMTPYGEFRSAYRQVQFWNSLIIEEKDPAARKELIEERDKHKTRMMAAYRRLTPEEISDLQTFLTERARD